MAEITAQMVKELRIKTDVGMMDCKNALIKCDGDLDKSIKYLREIGVAKAAKKADREAKEGIIATLTEDNDGIIFEINSETDFCSKGEKFRTLVAQVGTAIKASAATSLEEALRAELDGTSIATFIAERCAVIGENMKLSKFARYTLSNTGKVTSYIHMGGKVGVLLNVSCEKEETITAESFVTMCKDITLHIAACAPKSVDSSSLDPAFVAEEQDIARVQLIKAGKPVALLEKILPGKLNALYKQSCLTSQEFVKDSSISVAQLLVNKGKELGDTLVIVSFQRFQLGA